MAGPFRGPVPQLQVGRELCQRETGARALLWPVCLTHRRAFFMEPSGCTTLNGRIVWGVNYMSIKLLKMKKINLKIFSKCSAAKKIFESQ